MMPEPMSAGSCWKAKLGLVEAFTSWSGVTGIGTATIAAKNLPRVANRPVNPGAPNVRRPLDKH